MNKLKLLKLKLIVNKRNNQLNFSLPRKKIPEHLKSKLDNSKKVRLWLEDFE